MKKTGWVPINEAGYYIGRMLGEEHRVARANGKVYLRGWAWEGEEFQEGKVRVRNWPHSATGNEPPDAAAMAEDVRAKVAALRATTMMGEIPPDWKALEIALKAWIAEAGAPSKQSVAVAWGKGWLRSQGQKVPTTRTMERNIKRMFL